MQGMNRPLHARVRWDDQLGGGPSWSGAPALPSRRISTFRRKKKNSLLVPFQLNRVRVKRRRAACKNTTVLNHRHTAFFSCVEIVWSRALAGRESINARKRNWFSSKAPTFWTPECVCFKVRDTRHEALSQERESAGSAGTPVPLGRGGLRTSQAHHIILNWSTL